MYNVFVIGSKGIPAKYGGFETFVENLTSKRVNEDIRYHISCLSNESNKEFYYNNSRCFNVRVPNIGSAGAVLYDLLSLREAIKYIRMNRLENTIIYILTCRIGPFLKLFKKQIEDLGIKLVTNPDGNEWKRSKWNALIKKYWKNSEKNTIKYVDYVICDSKSIEKYIKKEYSKFNPNTEFIPYGADIKPSILKNDSKELLSFYNKNNIRLKEYYLIVGRFVPENNYELMIKEFIKSNTTKDLVIITNVEENKYYKELVQSTNFKNDNRIKFVGTIYNDELLKKIRENAFGYLHGHEVGGTNPSLLEALASTDINLLLNVNFNREVGEEAAIYFTKKEGDFCEVLNNLEGVSSDDVETLSKKAKKRIIDDYSWDDIIKRYESAFYKVVKEKI